MEIIILYFLNSGLGYNYVMKNNKIHTFHINVLI
jgi:hypothetical protein